MIMLYNDRCGKRILLDFFVVSLIYMLTKRNKTL